MLEGDRVQREGKMHFLRRIAVVAVAPALAGVVLLPRPASAGPLSFSAGDLVVTVEGNGSGTASGGGAVTGNTGSSANIYQDNQAAPMSLFEFSTTGAGQSPIGTLTLPQ